MIQDQKGLENNSKVPESAFSQKFLDNNFFSEYFSMSYVKYSYIDVSIRLDIPFRRYHIKSKRLFLHCIFIVCIYVK